MYAIVGSSFVVFSLADVIKISKGTPPAHRFSSWWVVGGGFLMAYRFGFGVRLFSGYGQFVYLLLRNFSGVGDIHIYLFPQTFPIGVLTLDKYTMFNPSILCVATSIDSSRGVGACPPRIALAITVCGVVVTFHFIRYFEGGGG